VVVCDKHPRLHHKLSQGQSCISCTRARGVRRAAPGIKNSRALVTASPRLVMDLIRSSTRCAIKGRRHRRCGQRDRAREATAIFHVCGACAPGHHTGAALRDEGSEQPHGLRQSRRFRPAWRRLPPNRASVRSMGAAVERTSAHGVSAQGPLARKHSTTCAGGNHRR